MKLTKIKKNDDTQILPYTTNKIKISFLWGNWSNTSNLYTFVQGIIDIHNDKIIMIVYKGLCTSRLNALLFL